MGSSSRAVLAAQHSTVSGALPVCLLIALFPYMRLLMCIGLAETKHFIYFYIGSLAILIWKS